MADIIFTIAMLCFDKANTDKEYMSCLDKMSKCYEVNKKVGYCRAQLNYFGDNNGTGR